MNLSQPLALQKELISEDGTVEIFDEKEILFAAADKTLGDSLEKGSLAMVAEALRRFRNLGWASALSAARLLHGVNTNWQEWEHEQDDTFVSWAVRETGYDAQTIRKRFCEWEFLNGDYIPKLYREKISGYTIRQLDKIYGICVSAKENKDGGYLNIVEEDYQITDEHWLALSEAVDEAMVADVVREIKDKEKNSNHMSLKITEDGTLYVHQGKNSQTVGHLFVDSENETVQKAIRRICENAGITGQNVY